MNLYVWLLIEIRLANIYCTRMKYRGYIKEELKASLYYELCKYWGNKKRKKNDWEKTKRLEKIHIFEEIFDVFCFCFYYYFIYRLPPVGSAAFILLRTPRALTWNQKKKNTQRGKKTAKIEKRLEWKKHVSKKKINYYFDLAAVSKESEKCL